MRVWTTLRILAAGIMLSLAAQIAGGAAPAKAPLHAPPPLYVAFIWNQHQPSYKDAVTGAYVMPWVRLHGAKDYLAMALLLEPYPGLHATFNLTPSLVAQIQDYAHGTVDLYEEVTAKPAAALTTQDKAFLRGNFFTRPAVARPGGDPRFGRTAELETAAGTGKPRLTRQDYLDLQVLFTLAWIDPSLRDQDHQLIRLLNKGRGFTEEDKAVALAAHHTIMRGILPLHRRLQNRGQIEVITTPYYHPILPLLVDVGAAQRPSPGLTLPSRPFAWPQDATAQIRKAVGQYTSVFGHAPAGLWPSEQAVSQECVPILADAGIQWIVTDETILAQSLGVSLRSKANTLMNIPGQLYVSGNLSPRLLHPELLYQPYAVETDTRRMTVLFRDQYLSDLIGFQYESIPGDAAARDLVKRLRDIAGRMRSIPGPHLVTIALDGENVWEFYREDKVLFFHTLYRLLSQEPAIRLVTVKEYLAAHPATAILPALATGSWNAGNLDRWVGSPAKNAAWDLLAQARTDLAAAQAAGTLPADRLQAAQEDLYTAEGSDYTWWFDSMPDSQAASFDDLFRLHLRGMYFHLGQEPPAALQEPILKSRGAARARRLTLPPGRP